MRTAIALKVLGDENSLTDKVHAIRHIAHMKEEVIFANVSEPADAKEFLK